LELGFSGGAGIEQSQAIVRQDHQRDLALRGAQPSTSVPVNSRVRCSIGGSSPASVTLAYTP